MNSLVRNKPVQLIYVKGKTLAFLPDLGLMQTASILACWDFQKFDSLNPLAGSH